jgi:SpoVK/Ycf46/Vps4 family AAA+-type ATPase
MEINKDQSSRHSEKDFREKLAMFIDSGAGIVHVRAREVIRASIAVAKQGILDDAQVYQWDVVNGMRPITETNVGNVINNDDADGQMDFTESFRKPLTELRERADEETPKYFVFINPHPYLENNPVFTQLLLDYSHVLPSSNIAIILITPDMPLPSEVDTQILSIYFDPPGLGELAESLNQITEEVESQFEDGISLSEEDVEKLCFVGAGMTKASFEMYASLAIVEAGREGKNEVLLEDITKGVSVGKTDIVNSNDILELYPSTDINNVGGLENLKSWVAKRRNCYSDEAREFGIEPPKGLVLVGPPGTGKSLVAKATSSELGVPLVRLDFGRVFNSLVGASEERIRKALRMVESMAPCVLFVDEIDKGLGGIGGSGDSGTSSRVLGSFLTWLQDNKAPVFVMVTANNVTGLPPEMLRRGRFDAIFATNLPTPEERREVLRIHLALRNRDIGSFEESEVADVIASSEGYVPAEIESAVKDALVNAFDNEEELTMGHVVEALRSMVPLSKAFKSKIDEMSEWAKNNATPAGRPKGSTTPPVNKSRIRPARSKGVRH